jgi:hypothetical protein
MMSSACPFCPGKPIEHNRQFIDQERVTNTVLRCLNKGKSCSIIGGAGMGKTSILKCIKRMFSQKASTAPTTMFRFIPVYFKPDLRKTGSLRSIYQQLIDETISQVKKWLTNCAADVPPTVFDDLDFPRRLIGPGPTMPEEDCRAFEGDLWEIIKAIRHAVASAKLLFLLDEMYRIEDQNIKETLARQWFELLDEENLQKEALRSHLAVVITCFKDHLEQFIPRRPDVAIGPIRDAIEPIYLRVLEKADAWQLMTPPFKETLDLELPSEVADEVYKLTGGHPLLLQSAMSDLWVEAQTKGTVDVGCVQDYIPTWSGRFPGMYRWIGEIISENQVLGPVFKLLLTGDKVWERAKLTEALKGLPVNLRYNHQLRYALLMLSSLGVVREVRRYTYQVSGELFRDWFEPLSTAHVDESNYRSQTDQLEDQITRTIDLLDQHRDTEGVGGIRERLKNELAILGTDRIQLVALEKSLTPENPMRADAFRRLIKDVQRIKYYVRFDIGPQLREFGIQVDSDLVA